MWSYRVKHSHWRPLKPSTMRKGYFCVSLQKNRRTVRFYVHRLVLEVFVGPCPDGMECRHLDGNPANNHLDNLCWGTTRENAADQRRHGRMLRGERRPLARLTDGLVRTIRRRHRKGDRRDGAKAIARELGVSDRAVRDAANGKTWNHVV